MLCPVFIFLGIASVAAQSAQMVRPSRQETLLNGLRTAVFQRKDSERVYLKLRINAGAAFDLQGKEGTMALLAGSFFPNPTARDYFREDLGGSLEISTTYDYIQISASARPDEFLALIESIANAVANPTIDKQTIASLKQAQLARIAEAESQPAYRGESAVLARLFGSFPYGRPVNGTRLSLANIDFADVIDARQRFLVADNSTLAISGPVDPNLAVRAAKRFFGAWSKADKSVPATFRQPEPPAREVSVIEEESMPDFWIAVRGVARGDVDFPAAEIFAEILKARLGQNLTASDVPAYVKNRAYLLRGAVVIGFPIGEKVDGGEFIRSLIAKPIEQSEFEAAKSRAASAYQNSGGDDIWLDSQTYKSTTAANAAAAISSASIADVRTLANRLAAEPVAAVRFAKKPVPAVEK